MSRLHQSRTKQTRLEQRSENRQRLADYYKGEGVFVYRNRSRMGSLELQKEVTNARGQKTKHVQPQEEFTSDNYFMGMVKTHELTLVRVVEPVPDKNNPVIAEAIQESTILNEGDKVPDEEMLIVDQPDIITTNGKVEHVLKDPKKQQKLNENRPATPNQSQVNVLLNENPLSGVEILA